MGKNIAIINNVVACHKPLINETLLREKVIMYCVEYESGKVRYYFPRIDRIPERVKRFIETSLQYYPSNDRTVYRYGQNV